MARMWTLFMKFGGKRSLPFVLLLFDTEKILLRSSRSNVVCYPTLVVHKFQKKVTRPSELYACLRSTKALKIFFPVLSTLCWSKEMRRVSLVNMLK